MQQLRLFFAMALLYVSGDNSTHHQEYNAVYGLSGRQVYLCCNFVNILVVLSLSVVLSAGNTVLLCRAVSLNAEC